MSVQLVKPGEVARAHRHTITAVRFVVKGSGAFTTVEGERFEWSAGDFIELPAWMGHHHENPNQEDAFIAGWTDWPLQRLTGNFYYEEL